MRVTLHPGAQADVSAAAEFYELDGSARLAARFVAEFKRLSWVLSQSPGLGTPLPGGKRSLTMRAFPYSVVYRQSAEEINILVVRHHRRHPSHGRLRR